jgi:hypothetical protein
MITTIHSYGGVTATVYVMQRGEKIPRHQHPFAHTTSVAAGRSQVEIGVGLDHVFEMGVGLDPYLLPPNIDHEIRVLEDGTVVVNMSAGQAAGQAYADPSAVQAQAGGVTLVGDEDCGKDDRPKFANPAEERAHMREHGFPYWPRLDP